jgi:hypothetical protein
MATFYANILVNRESRKPSYQSIFTVKLKKLRNFKRFGEWLWLLKNPRKTQQSRQDVHACGVATESFGQYLPHV